uniref:Acyl-coenzyme A thioesterase 6 n=1 Tax=Lygus hesperus TaxID=30085 RepID=A0A0A9W7J7_LYGHE
MRLIELPSVHMVTESLNSIQRFFSSSNRTCMPLKTCEYNNPEFPAYAPLITYPLFTQDPETFIRTPVPSLLDDDGGVWRYDTLCRYSCARDDPGDTLQPSTQLGKVSKYPLTGAVVEPPTGSDKLSRIHIVIRSSKRRRVVESVGKVKKFGRALQR